MTIFILLVLFIVCLTFHICIIKESDHNQSGLAEKVDWLILALSLLPSFVLLFYFFEFDKYELGELHVNDFLTFLAFASFLWFPFCMTGLNIKHLIKGINSSLADLITIIVGGVFHMLLMGITLNITSKDYTKAVYPDEYHELTNSKYDILIYIIMFMGVVGLITLCARKPEKTPPLVSALSIAFCGLMLMVCPVFYIQMSKHFEEIHIMMYVYYANLIIIATRCIRFHITEQVRLANERNMIYRTRVGEWFGKIINKISSMTLFSFILILPLAMICEIIYIITGQGVDGFIKAFTMTADWTFSTQIPPPPMEYSGHYLCTVAVTGHEKVVKPLRYGVRHNHRIVVNRQLLVANAFEDLIHERMPKSHRKIRNFYDKYGYPLSRHITTKTRADIIYILMKPLECVFLLCLYAFDVNPENRIAIQYSEYKK